MAQNRGLTLDIIVPDVCQVPVSMLSFSRVGLVFTFCNTCKLINVEFEKIHLFRLIDTDSGPRLRGYMCMALPLTPLSIVQLQLVLHRLQNVMINDLVHHY